MTTFRVRTLLLLACPALALLGCATERPFVWAQNLPPEMAQGNVAGAAIQPRDSVVVTVMGQPGMSGEFPVRDDGGYLQPTLGNVVVAGRSPEQVALDLQTRMKDMIVNPQITVSISKAAPIRVNVVGEVKTPGAYELTRDRSLAAALAAAGWLTDFASKDRIFVVRPTAQSELRVRFRAQDVAAAEKNSARFRLRDGDVVVVE